MSGILQGKVLKLNSYVLKHHELITQIQEMRDEKKEFRNNLEKKRDEYLEDPEKNVNLSVYGTQNDKTEHWLVCSIDEESRYWTNLENILYSMETEFRRFSSDMLVMEQQIRIGHPLKHALRDWNKIMDRIMDDTHDLESTASSNLYSLNGFMDLDSFLVTMKRNDVYSVEFGKKMTCLTNAIVNFLLFVSAALRK